MNRHRLTSLSSAATIRLVAATTGFGIALAIAPLAHGQAAAEHGAVAAGTSAGSAAAGGVAPKPAAAMKTASSAGKQTAKTDAGAPLPGSRACLSVVTAPAINLDAGKSTLFKLPDDMVLTLRTLGD
jgi:hypothetical protein